MQKNYFFSLSFSLLLALALPSYAVLEIPNTQPKVGAEVWKPILDKTWEGIKKRNIEPFSTAQGLIHRPKSETPGDAVSEGVGYGMLLALYSNDQETFNTIWEAGNNNLWQGCYYDWRISASGTKERGAATDAEEDVALALIFANKLVEKGLWDSYTSPKLSRNYLDHAKKILDCMWSTGQITSSGILAPGAGWGGDDFVNPGYFSPAWYRIFSQVDPNHNWMSVVEKSYSIIEANPGYSMGLIPDWMRPDGSFYGGSLGYNPYLSGRAFFKDAIRTLWRVAIDAIWFDEPRAKAYLQNALTFINSKGGASASNFYQIEGEKAGVLVPADDKWLEFNDADNEETWRYRREHSHLTIGMWSTAATAVGTDDDKIDFTNEMAKFYEYDEDANFFGLIRDTVNLEDTLHNEMYFDQFLAWFGVSLMSGTFCNVIENLDNPKVNTKGVEINPFVSIPKKLSSHVSNKITLRYGAQSIEFTAPSHWTKTLWQVYDLKGKEILSSVSGNKLSFNSNNHKGVFIVKASSEKGVAIRKLQIH